jgi:hypothetical protein
MEFLANLIISFLSYLLHLSGFVLVYASSLYENEEGQIQSKIVEWWVRLDDKGLASRSRIAAFMQEVARLTGRGFDGLFGNSLLSLRFVAVSIYLSFASLFLFLIFAFPLAHDTGSATRLGAIRIFLFFIGLALVPAIVNGSALWERLIRGIWWGVIPWTVISMAGFIAFVYKRQGAASTFRGIGFTLLPLAVSFLADVAFIFVTRLILRRIPTIDRISTIVIMFVGNLLILALIIVGLPYVGFKIAKYLPLFGGIIMLSLPLNSIDILVGCAALIVALLLLVHRALWPLIQRPLYAIQRHELIKKRKKWLLHAGVALIILPWHLTLESLKALLEKLF